MTQDAVVIKILPNDMAEAAVARTTACGGNCASCESCMFQSELRAIARNNIGAAIGQRVIIASKSSKIFSAVFLVYVLPLVLFIAAYVLAHLAGAGEGLCILVSFFGLLLGAGIMVLSQRLKKDKNSITFDIIR